MNEYYSLSISSLKETGDEVPVNPYFHHGRRHVYHATLLFAQYKYEFAYILFSLIGRHTIIKYVPRHKILEQRRQKH